MCVDVIEHIGYKKNNNNKNSDIKYNIHNKCIDRNIIIERYVIQRIGVYQRIYTERLQLCK